MSEVIADQMVVKIGDVDVTVKKLNLRKIANLSKALKDLPADLLNQKEVATNADFLKGLPDVIMEVLPKYTDLVAQTLHNQVTGDQIEEADIDELFDLVEAFLEVNNIPKVIARLGKMKALATVQKSEKKMQAIG